MAGTGSFHAFCVISRQCHSIPGSILHILILQIFLRIITFMPTWWCENWRGATGLASLERSLKRRRLDVANRSLGLGRSVGGQNYPLGDRFGHYNIVNICPQHSPECLSGVQTIPVQICERMWGTYQIQTEVCTWAQILRPSHCPCLLQAVRPVLTTFRYLKRVRTVGLVCTSPWCLPITLFVVLDLGLLRILVFHAPTCICSCLTHVNSSKGHPKGI